MATIDNLEIEIAGSSEKASKSIEKLVQELDLLTQKLGKVNGNSVKGFSNSLDVLSQAMKRFKDSGVTASTFNNVANGIERFAKIDTAKIANVGNSLNSLSSNLQTMSSASFNAQGIIDIANALNKFGGKTATQATANLPTISGHLKTFIAGLNDVKNVNFDINGLSELIKSISKLGYGTATQATANLPNISKHLREFIVELNGIGSLNFDMTNVSSLVNAISRLGSVASGRAVTNIPLIAKALKELFTTLSTAPNVSRNVIDMTNALANLARTGANSGRATNSLSKNLNTYTSSTASARKGTLSLAAAFGKLYANYWLIIRAFGLLKKSIVNTSDYIESFNYYNVALGKIAGDWKQDFEKYGYDNATAYSESFTERMNDSLGKLSGIKFDEKNMRLVSTEVKNLGLNIKEVTQYAAQLASVTNSVGLTGEASIIAADSFTKLAGDISSLFNVDYKTVSQNLQSGLIGQSRALYKYGIDITNATLQTYAYNLGLEKSVSEMTQAEKMQLRMIAILDQSRVSWGDLANTINQPANQMRVLKAQATELSMMFGQLFIPILSKVIPVITGIVIALKRLINTIAEFLGIKIDYSGMSQGFNDMEVGAEELSDELDDVKKSAKEAKAGLRGFDELKTINMPDTSKMDLSGANGMLDLTDEIIAASQEYLKEWQKAFDRMQNIAEGVANRIQNAFERIADISKYIASIWLSGFKASFDTTSLDVARERLMGISTQMHNIFGDKNLQNSANNFFEEFLFNMGRVRADMVNIGISIANNLLGGIEKYLTGNAERITKYFTEMFDIGTVVSKTIGDIMDDISDIFNVFEGENATNFTSNLLEMFLNPLMSFQTVFAKLIRDYLNGIHAIISDNKEQISIALDNLFLILSTWTEPLANALTQIGDGWVETYDNHISPALERFTSAFSNLANTILVLWNKYVSPFLTETGEMISSLMGKYITPAMNDIIKFGGQFIEMVSVMMSNLQPVISFFTAILVPQILEGLERIRNVSMFVMETIGNGVQTLMAVLTGLSEFILGVLTLDFERAGEGIKRIFKGVGNSIIHTFESAINLVIRSLNTLNFTVPDWVPGIGGENFGFYLSEVNIPAFATGGFPQTADLFYANENGIPELVGTMGGRTAVASGTEITGISDAIYSTGQTEAGLLETAVSLLQVIAEKEYGISSDTIFKSVQNSARNYSKRTGRLAFE